MNQHLFSSTLSANNLIKILEKLSIKRQLNKQRNLMNFLPNHLPTYQSPPIEVRNTPKHGAQLGLIQPYPSS